MRRVLDAGILYRVADRYFRTLKRIYKSVVFGFLVAGFIVALVPSSFWPMLFPPPVGFWGVVENAALGVVVGMFSFIGSIGIVPFAAALAIGGVGFAGVVGCIVADLITIPVLNVWRRYFGITATAYIFAVFFTAMVGSTVLITYFFQALDWLPNKIHALQPGTFHFNVDYTLILTVFFVALTIALWLVKRAGDGRRSVSGVPVPQAKGSIR